MTTDHIFDNIITTSGRLPKFLTATKVGVGPVLHFSQINHDLNVCLVQSFRATQAQKSLSSILETL